MLILRKDYNFFMKNPKNKEKKLFITAEQNGFDMLTRNISRNTFLSDGAKALYIYLNSQQNENFNLSQESIAHYLHKSYNTIKKEIKELKDNGFLTLERKDKSNNYYYVLRTSPKIEKLINFDVETITSAFFDQDIQFIDIKKLYKKNLITLETYNSVIDKIHEILKTDWLNKE